MILKGITWNHSRAFPPLVAVSQRYEELNPGIRIQWEKRTLDEFGHKPIDELTSDYDLIVIDHPWAGFCFKNHLVLDLREHLKDSQWLDLKENCVGLSFESYVFQEKLLAIPIDAATPTASWRPDLIEKRDLQIPETWQDLIKLADEKQAVMPGFKADLFLNWLMLLHALEAQPFQNNENIALYSEAMEAMFLLKRLAEPMPVDIFDWNPIEIAERMSRYDEFAYCAFAYSYGNYCRPSFVKHPLKYGDLVTLGQERLRSILGGTGISISTNCRNIELALDFSLYCADASVQKNIYTYTGGQAVRREAWKYQEIRTFTGNFYIDSCQAIEEAILRPRYTGYVQLQDLAGVPLQEFVKGNISERKALEEMNEFYRQSL